MLTAAKEGNARKVQLLLECPEVDINYADYDYNTGLWLASKMGYLGVVKLLVNDSRTDVNGGRRVRSTPLYIAARERYLDVVQGPNSIVIWLDLLLNGFRFNFESDTCLNHKFSNFF